MGDGMSKVKIEVTIENNEAKKTREYKAVLTENKLIYQEEDATIVKFDYTNNCLTRENAALYLKYKFEKGRVTPAFIKVKDIKSQINLPLETTTIKIKNKNIEIRYHIESEIFNFKIEVI